MGRYGLILCANESYTNNIAIGINFDPIWGHKKITNVLIISKSANFCEQKNAGGRLDTSRRLLKNRNTYNMLIQIVKMQYFNI